MLLTPVWNRLLTFERNFSDQRKCDIITIFSWKPVKKSVRQNWNLCLKFQLLFDSRNQNRIQGIFHTSEKMILASAVVPSWFVGDLFIELLAIHLPTLSIKIGEQVKPKKYYWGHLVLSAPPSHRNLSSFVIVLHPIYWAEHFSECPILVRHQSLIQLQSLGYTPKFAKADLITFKDHRATIFDVLVSGG